jgi:hypothetical protein
MANDYGYTVVQHSGYGYNNDPQFEHALESRKLGTKVEADRVTKAGGVIFPGYTEAEDFAEKAQYQPDNASIIPNAKGTFSDQLIDDLRIYIPVREIVG